MAVTGSRTHAMNEVDLAIIGAVVLLALIGLFMGILKPLSGIGGLVLGIIAAVHFGGEVAALLAEYIDNETVRGVAGFVAIVVVVAVATRLAAVLIKKALSLLVLGWLDNAAGAIGGAGLGIVLAGTAVFLLPAFGYVPAGNLMSSSKLATGISRASLVSTDRPWCSSIVDADNTKPCTDLTGLLNKYLGRHIPDRINNSLDQEEGPVIEVVKGVLADGPPLTAAEIFGGELNIDGLLGEGQEAIAEAAVDTLPDPPR